MSTIDQHGALHDAQGLYANQNKPAAGYDLAAQPAPDEHDSGPVEAAEAENVVTTALENSDWCYDGVDVNADTKTVTVRLDLTTDDGELDETEAEGICHAEEDRIQAILTDDAPGWSVLVEESGTLADVRAAPGDADMAQRIVQQAASLSPAVRAQLLKDLSAQQSTATTLTITATFDVDDTFAEELPDWPVASARQSPTSRTASRTPRCWTSTSPHRTDGTSRPASTTVAAHTGRTTTSGSSTVCAAPTRTSRSMRSSWSRCRTIWRPRTPGWNRRSAAWSTARWTKPGLASPTSRSVRTLSS